MAYNEKQKEYTMNYMKEKLDEIKFRVPKGQKEVIREHAEKQGEKLTPFIVRAITETIQRDTGAAPSSTNPMLPSDTLKVAESAAETSGETIPQYIKRAVSAQSERDRASLRIGLNPVAGEMILNNANSK